MTREEKIARAKSLREQGAYFTNIAEFLGVATSTVHAWLSDPDGSKARTRKDSYRGVCKHCGGPTTGCNGRDAAPDECKTCLSWTDEEIVRALRSWAAEYGASPKEAHTRPGAPGHGRLPGVEAVANHFGSWNGGLLAAGLKLNHDRRPETTAAMAEMIRSGAAAREVAERFGVSEDAVRMRLRYHGMLIGDLRRG